VCSRRHFITALCVLGSSTASQAQTPEAPTAQALKVTAPPKLDGRLDDAIWRKAAIVAGFNLGGLADIKQAARVRLRPYFLGGAESLEAVAAPGPTRRITEIGIDDLKWQATSTLTADLAVNPDFAQTEVDAQQVNLTRFSLFFPEKRQFFIEGADSLRMGVGLLHFGPPPLELFYSRNIGLSNQGTPITIPVGGKLTGKVAGFDVGVLNSQTAETERQPGENFTVARVRKEILGRSYVGAIATNRQGARERLIGVRGSLKPRPKRWRIRQFELTPSTVWYHDNEPDVGLRPVQQRRPVGGDPGPRELHFPDHRQRVSGLQRDPLHGRNL